MRYRWGTGEVQVRYMWGTGEVQVRYRGWHQQVRYRSDVSVMLMEWVRGLWFGF